MIIKENKIREDRIHMEAIVDAYGSDERALSWYYYLEGILEFPFCATCVIERKSSPLQKGEKVDVVGMPSEEDCIQEVLVMITFEDRVMAVPLNQLKPMNVVPRVRQAILDWHYWVARGYQF